MRNSNKNLITTSNNSLISKNKNKSTNFLKKNTIYEDKLPELK